METRQLRKWYSVTHSKLNTLFRESLDYLQTSNISKYIMNYENYEEAWNNCQEQIYSIETHVENVENSRSIFRNFLRDYRNYCRSKTTMTTMGLQSFAARLLQCVNNLDDCFRPLLNLVPELYFRRHKTEGLLMKRIYREIQLVLRNVQLRIRRFPQT